jgi:hypothetical protein
MNPRAPVVHFLPIDASMNQTMLTTLLTIAVVGGLRFSIGWDKFVLSPFLVAYLGNLAYRGNFNGGELWPDALFLVLLLPNIVKLHQQDGAKTELP